MFRTSPQSEKEGSMINYFPRHKVLSTALALSLVMTTTNFACNTSQWLSTIGQYLPVAIQVAQSIVSLIGVFGNAQTAADQQAVTQIGEEATKDYQLLQSLYQQYQTSPSASTEAEIENALSLITTNLPAMLSAAHIKDQHLLQSVTAAVNILMTVADTIISQLPVKNPQLKIRKENMKKTAKAAGLTPATVKTQWNVLVCGGNLNCMNLVHQ
jgi:hypothetical protein